MREGWAKCTAPKSITQVQPEADIVADPQSIVPSRMETPAGRQEALADALEAAMATETESPPDPTVSESKHARRGRGRARGSGKSKAED